MDNNITETYLSHHGTKGMKWGIRRYQYKDGSLTPAGKKKYGTKANFEKVQAVKRAGERKKSGVDAKRAKANARTEAEVAKLKKKYGLEDEKKTDQPVKKEPTIDELREKAAYMNAKNSYDREMAVYNANHPKQVSAGRRITESLLNDVVLPAAKTKGREWLEKQIGTAIKLNADKNKSKTDKLKDKYNELKAEKDLSDLKKAMKEDNSEYENLIKEYNVKKMRDDIRKMDINLTKPDEYDLLKREYDMKKVKKDIQDLDKPDKYADLKDMQAYNKYQTTKDLYEKYQRKEAEKETVNKDSRDSQGNDSKKSREKNAPITDYESFINEGRKQYTDHVDSSIRTNSSEYKEYHDNGQSWIAEFLEDPRYKR